MMQIILIYLGATSLLLLWFLRLAKSHSGLIGIAVLSAVGTILWGGLSPLWGIPLCLTFLSSVLICPWIDNVAVIRTVLISSVICGYTIVFAVVMPEIYERMALRNQYPMFSVADRLKYESVRQVEGRDSLLASVELPAALEERLKNSKYGYRMGIREGMLYRLHDGISNEFVAAIGFGPDRMIHLRRSYVELPTLETIPFETVADVRSTGFQANGSTALHEIPVHQTRGPIPQNELQELHTDGISNFLSNQRIGYVRDVDHVAGFQSHRFSKIPGTTDTAWEQGLTEWEQPHQARRREGWRTSWAIVRLELVGILRHDHPVAYVSEHLPQLDESANYPIRELDDFESSSLERLQTKEDVVIENQPNRIRMLGSLRAGESCQKCHRVGHGQLLGALSYELLKE